MKKNRILIVALILALLISLLSIAVSADTTDVIPDYSTDVTDSADIENGDNAKADAPETNDNNEVNREDVEEKEDGLNTDAEKEASEENFFTLLFEGVKTYATEILSALTLAASLLLAYAYKSGLTPVITNALTNLGKLLAGMRESASESEKLSKEITSAISDRLTIAESTVAKLTESIEAVNANLKREEESSGERKRLSAVLEAQIDMMYSLFISSALPEYQKAAVAEKIEKMKEAIADAEK